MSITNTIERRVLTKLKNHNMNGVFAVFESFDIEKKVYNEIKGYIPHQIFELEDLKIGTLCSVNYNFDDKKMETKINWVSNINNLMSLNELGLVLKIKVKHFKNVDHIRLLNYYKDEENYVEYLKENLDNVDVLNELKFLVNRNAYDYFIKYLKTQQITKSTKINIEEEKLKKQLYEINLLTNTKNYLLLKQINKYPSLFRTYFLYHEFSRGRTTFDSSKYEKYLKILGLKEKHEEETVKLDIKSLKTYFKTGFYGYFSNYSSNNDFISSTIYLNKLAEELFIFSSYTGTIDFIKDLEILGIIRFVDKDHFTFESDYQKEKRIANKLNEWRKLTKKIKTQKPDIKAYFDNNFLSILTGGPGTGKTSHIIKLVTQLIDQKTYKTDEIEILTPTAKAADVINQRLNIENFEAKTIHRFLNEYNLLNISGKNEDETKESRTKVLIIDEFSMVDIHFFDVILQNFNNIEKIILSGDYNQLPTFNKGNLLKDIINYYSEDSQVLKLKGSFRANKNIEKFYESILENKPFRFDGENVIAFDRRDMGRKYEAFRYYLYDSEFGSSKNIKELFPNYKNELFVIYALLKEFYGCNYPKEKTNWVEKAVALFPLNSQVEDINYKLNIVDSHFQSKIWNSFSSFVYPFIQNVNKYHLNIYNGELGQALENYERDLIELRFYKDDLKNKIIYDKKSKDFSPAYCLNYYKVQGSESDVVIIYFDKNIAKYITKNHLYTALSRAKKKIIIMNDIEAFKKSVPELKEINVLTNMNFEFKNKNNL